MRERFIAFDVETTGLSPEGCRLTEVAGVAFRLDGTIEARFEELCHPGHPIPPEVSALTGITDAMVAHAAPPEEVIERFLEFAQGGVLVAHNALFDGSFLAAELERAQKKLPALTMIDTLDWARSQLRLRDFRLSTVARYFHLRPQGSHRAALDAHTAMGVFLALAARAGATDRLRLMAAAKPFPLSMCAVSAVQLPPGLSGLPELIEVGRRVHITYEGGTQGELPRPVTPKGLTRIGPASYLIAYCHRDKREKQFRLDRITSLRPLEETPPRRPTPAPGERNVVAHAGARAVQPKMAATPVGGARGVRAKVR